MHIPNRWFWYIYFYLYVVLISYSTLEFVRPDSAVNLYYQFLLAFKPYFLLPYCLHLLNIIVGLLSLVPFYSYISGQPLFSPSFARCLFFARLILEWTGRSYEIKSLQALTYHNHLLPGIIVAIYVVFIAGSYWGHYSYAFRRKVSR